MHAHAHAPCVHRASRSHASTQTQTPAHRHRRRDERTKAQARHRQRLTEAWAPAQVQASMQTQRNADVETQAEHTPACAPSGANRPRTTHTVSCVSPPANSQETVSVGTLETGALAWKGVPNSRTACPPPPSLILPAVKPPSLRAPRRGGTRKSRLNLLNISGPRTVSPTSCRRNSQTPSFLRIAAHVCLISCACACAYVRVRYTRTRTHARTHAHTHTQHIHLLGTEDVADENMLRNCTPSISLH